MKPVAIIDPYVYVPNHRTTDQQETLIALDRISAQLKQFAALWQLKATENNVLYTCCCCGSPAVMHMGETEYSGAGWYCKDCTPGVR